MPTIFDKLNLKNARAIVVLNAPASFEAELASLAGVEIARSLKASTALQFGLAFVRTQAELDASSSAFSARAVGDATLWFAYPKKSSKKYACEFDRDSGWKVVGKAGYEPVRMIAIDADWSALRFRKVEFIKSLKRDPARAISNAGRQRAAKK